MTGGPRCKLYRRAACTAHPAAQCSQYHTHTRRALHCYDEAPVSPAPPSPCCVFPSVYRVWFTYTIHSPPTSSSTSQLCRGREWPSETAAARRGETS